MSTAQPTPGQTPEPHGGIAGQANPYGQPAYGQAPQHDVGQPAPGSRYGTQPYAAYGTQPGAPAYGEIAEPPKFRKLLSLTLASAALWVLSSLPGLFGGESMRDQFREQMTAGSTEGLSPEDVEAMTSMFGTFMVVGVVISLLIGLALYALVYFNLRKGKNWARILGIVLAILGLLGALGGVFSFLTTPGVIGILSSLLSAAFAVVNILWLVHAFNSEVAAYTQRGRVG